MPDIPCLYDMGLISEKENLKEDILNGKALDILLILLSGADTIKNISEELNIPIPSVQLYIKRLVKANLIEVKDVQAVNGKLEKIYSLVSTDIDILNYLQNNCKNSNEKDNIELSAQHFASLTREIIRNINNYSEKPHEIKAYFIKADEDKIKEFKNDLNALFEKYKALENLDSKDTYGFISVLAPYKGASKK